MNLDHIPLKTTITHEGQTYIDQPVFDEVSKAKPLSLEVARAYGRKMAPIIEEFSHYAHRPIRWVQPDGKGGFVPKDTQ